MDHYPVLEMDYIWIVNWNVGRTVPIDMARDLNARRLLTRNVFEVRTIGLRPKRTKKHDYRKEPISYHL